MQYKGPLQDIYSRLNMNGKSCKRSTTLISNGMNAKHKVYIDVYGTLFLNIFGGGGGYST